MTSHSVDPFDDEDAGSEVRKLYELRPVPPRRRSGPSSRQGTVQRPRPPVLGWPVYDPYSARRRRTPEWLVNYVATLVVGDVLAAALAALLARHLTLAGTVPSIHVLLAGVLLWPVLQAMVGSYAERRQGTGTAEYGRVMLAGLVAMATVGVIGCLFPGLGPLVLIAPATTVLTMLNRLVNRHRLHAARRHGLMTKRVVLVGRDVAVIDLNERMRRDVAAGLTVVGACVPRPRSSSLLVEQGVAVLGGLDDVLHVVDDARADAVLVASASETAGHYLRDLAWRLEGTNIEVLVSPGVIEVMPSRLQVRPTISVPLLHIAEPEFRGYRRVVKSLLDLVLATVLLVASSPLFLVAAVLIKLTGPGPVFYRHRRIGRRGREFDLLKFRSMVRDADTAFHSLLMFNEGNEVQFKMRRDPRVTAIGRFLRRSSLDELPQLINVLGGSMSLVGPRPHVTREVERYGSDMHRRLLVKPGITGLWQVSGRSDLSWEEAVELDVRYVENWSIGLDLSILWRTFHAVLRSSGAY
jgi:exopolysaccharide biosynthesis polyprenyl glycosylphosphotransferase